MKNTQLLLAGIIIVLFSCSNKGVEPKKEGQKEKAELSITKYFRENAPKNVVLDSVIVVKIDSITEYEFIERQIETMEANYKAAIDDLHNSVVLAESKKGHVSNEEYQRIVADMSKKKQKMLDIQAPLISMVEHSDESDDTRRIYSKAQIKIFSKENGNVKNVDMMVLLDEKLQLVNMNI